MISGFQDESINPTLIMRNVVDYTLRFKDISDNIIFFADAYLTLPDFRRDICSSKFIERYIFDYYRNHQNTNKLSNTVVFWDVMIYD